MIDIGKVQLNTDGTGIGGNMNKVGMHQFTLARWRGNSYNKGLPDPTKTNYEPGTEALGGGFDGMGAVKDQMIDQGIALCVSTDVEPTCAYFQGPQRVASEHNQITGSDVWGIFDFHLVAIINNLTGKKLTGLHVDINMLQQMRAISGQQLTRMRSRIMFNFRSDSERESDRISDNRLPSQTRKGGILRGSKIRRYYAGFFGNYFLIFYFLSQFIGRRSKDQTSPTLSRICKAENERNTITSPRGSALARMHRR